MKADKDCELLHKIQYILREVKGLSLAFLQHDIKSKGEGTLVSADSQNANALDAVTDHNLPHLRIYHKLVISFSVSHLDPRHTEHPQPICQKKSNEILAYFP